MSKSKKAFEGKTSASVIGGNFERRATCNIFAPADDVGSAGLSGCKVSGAFGEFSHALTMAHHLPQIFVTFVTLWGRIRAVEGCSGL
jgi:hypothetical protein